MAYDLTKELLWFWSLYWDHPGYQRDLFKHWKSLPTYSGIVSKIAADPELRKNLTVEDLK